MADLNPEPQMKTISPVSIVLSFISLMIFWMSMSGFFDAIHLSMGVFSVVFVLVLFHKIRRHRFFSDEMEDLLQLRFARVPYYVLWLIWQILVSGLHVARVILSRSMPIEPSMVRFKVDLPSAHAKMILGNSITLTPGTLTVDITGDEFIVHALTPATFAGILDDSMPRQVLKLFSKADRAVISEARVTHSNQ